MSILAREAPPGPRGERGFMRACPACGMGVDDPSLEHCPLCFYDLAASPPEGSEPVVLDGDSVPDPTPIRLISGLDVAIAVLPLVVLLVILFVAISEK